MKSKSELNAIFRAHGYRWRRAESVFAYWVPADLNAQDWVLVDSDLKIHALGDGPTRERHANSLSREVALARLAEMGICSDDERHAELLSAVCPPEPNYPSPEDFYSATPELW